MRKPVYGEYDRARSLRRFSLHGFDFNVVRWRNDDGKHWRGYTALIHDRLCVSTDIERNSADSYEDQMSRMFKTPESLRAALEEMHKRAKSETP